jgi:two-component system OmpR family sensor kinase
MAIRRDGARRVPLRTRLVRAPLWARLVAGTLLLVAVALVLTGFVGTRMLRGYLTDKLDQQLQFASHVRGPQPGGPPASGDQNGGRPSDDGRGRRFMGVYSVILNADGTIAEQVADPFTDDRPALPMLSSAEVADRHGHPFTVNSASGRSGRWRVVVRSEDQDHSRLVALSLAEADSTVGRLALIDAGVGAVVLACLAVAGYFLVRVSLRPLVEIEDTAEAIAAGDLARRVPDRAVPAEVARLGGALNGMLVQIESAFRDRESSAASARRSEDRMRRFVADASHELRTPLTSIRGFAELYRQEAYGRGDAADPEAAKVLRRIEEEASRMGLLVEDLLLLARMDQQRPLEARPVDLLSLAAGAVLDAQALAPDREIDLIRLDGSDSPVTVIGDEVRLRQVLTNLIANALTHTPAGTPFRVGVGVAGRGEAGPAGEGGRSVVLEVADEGPGLPAGQAERVFERFYRAERSRSRAHGGSGLGLSIVAALVHAHGGSVELKTAPGEGAVFRVLLRGV